jgi:hypothetical protein
VAGELIAGLRVVFTVFAEDMGADVQGGGLLLCLVKLSPSTQTTTVAPKLNDPPATLMPTAIY